MIDRFNVSFAALRMKADLGFSDKVYGFGASAFFITYALLEIPGAIVAERWSVRKWIARIMVSWGLITILTAFIQNASGFYVARVILGGAEASFFPAIIVYLTRWFTLKERARAIAAFYSASSVSAFVGSAVAGWLLPVHWLGIPGWRWLFIVEGVPAIVAGVITIFYLTERPSEAMWLSEAERSSVVSALVAESRVHRKDEHQSFWSACKDSRLFLIVAGYFFYILGFVTNTLWMPTFLQRLSNFPAATVARFVMIPAAAGALGLLLNSWIADRSGKYKWHTVIPVFCGGCCYLAIDAASGHFALVMLLFTLYYFFSTAAFATLWAMPTTFLSKAAAAAAFGLINCVGQTGGFFGPSIVGYLNDATGSIRSSIVFIASSFLASAVTLSFLQSTLPIGREGDAAQDIALGASITQR
jgi:MFS transporter, ACS family, tartrate transporter